MVHNRHVIFYSQMLRISNIYNIIKDIQNPLKTYSSVVVYKDVSAFHRSLPDNTKQFFRYGGANDPSMFEIDYSKYQYIFISDFLNTPDKLINYFSLSPSSTIYSFMHSSDLVTNEILTVCMELFKIGYTIPQIKIYLNLRKKSTELEFLDSIDNQITQLHNLFINHKNLNAVNITNEREVWKYFP